MKTGKTTSALSSLLLLFVFATFLTRPADGAPPKERRTVATEREHSSFGVRWQAQGDTALDATGPRESKPPLPLRSAAALQRRPRSPSRKHPKLRRPDVIYYPTPEETAAEMLRLANIKQGDVLYDLGSGDGRIPILAAQRYGIRAVGIEIDPKLVMMARERAREAQVDKLVSFHNADMFRTNIGEASVVTLYLSNRINLLLRPKLLAELQPGSRIISHDFHMGDWAPEQTVKVPWQNNLYRTVYLWTVPARSRGKTTSSVR